VGFLSLFENYGNIEVGALFKVWPQRFPAAFATTPPRFALLVACVFHLQNPVFPVWVLCSESHYSCLFGPSDGALDLRSKAVTNA
jgi:hypothetical protein